MKPSIKIALLVYVIVMIGCIAAFHVQKTIVYDDHIFPGNKESHSPILISLKDKESGEVHEGEITFVDNYVVTNPLRMGNEIEEHLLSLMAANLATGVLLLFIILISSKNNMSTRTLLLSVVLLFGLLFGCSQIELAKPDDWITRYTGKEGIILDGPEGSAGVDVPKDINGRATIHIYDTYYKNTECRIIAIDNSGKIHMPKQTSMLVPEKQYRSTNGIFPNLKLSQIKEFRFQTRVITNEQK